jgi:ribonuclease BN (tRNA processing enzyme)
MTVSGATLDVTVLGSSDAFGSCGHLHATYLVEASRSTFLVDCGPAVLSAMKKHGVDTARIDFVAISHLHGDHFGGLPFLILEYMFERPRQRPLLVLGPPGIEARFWELFRALYRDVTAKHPLQFDLTFRELAADSGTTVNGVAVFASRVPHQTDEISLALRFDAGGKRLLYSGDTPWFAGLAELTRDVDLFLCECTSWDEATPRHIDWQTLKAHLPELACRRIVLMHLGKEMRAHCGELGVECAVEGAVLRV